jgi:hypothetical protein
MPVRTVFALICTLLGACAAQVAGDSGANPLNAGGTLILLQDLTVPGGQARVFLQAGQVVDKTQLNIYQPHCNFEQRRLSDGSAVIAVDRFEITAIREGEDFIVQRHSLRYAALSMGGGDYGPSHVNRYLHFALSSSRQPDVMRLTCHGGFDLPGLAQLPRPSEMRAALAGYVELERVW